MNLIDVIDCKIITSSEKGNEYDLIYSRNLYNESTTNLFRNLYSDSCSLFFNPLIFLYFYNNFTSSFNINLLKISGSSLNEGSNKYWLEFLYSNVDIDNNYFYIDSLNRLTYSCFSDDSNLEYIQADFNINDVYIYNRFISFNSYLFGDFFGNFRVCHFVGLIPNNYDTYIYF